MIARVWSTTSQLEAECICSLLQGFDIGAIVESSYAFYAIGFPTALTPLIVVVPGEEAQTARGLIAQYWRRLTGNQLPVPDSGEVLEDCRELFAIDEAEEARFQEIVARAERKTRLMWWLVVLVQFTSSGVILLFLPWLLSKRTRPLEADAPATSRPGSP